MTEQFTKLEKKIFNDCRKYELHDATDIILLQKQLLTNLELIEDAMYFEEIKLHEYYSLKYSTRELITTISWALYHNYYNEFYVSKTFIDLLDEYLKREGGE